MHAQISWPKDVTKTPGKPQLVVVRSVQAAKQGHLEHCHTVCGCEDDAQRQAILRTAGAAQQLRRQCRQPSQESPLDWSRTDGQGSMLF